MHYEVYIDLVFLTNLLMDYGQSEKSSGAAEAGNVHFWVPGSEPYFPAVFSVSVQNFFCRH